MNKNVFMLAESAVSILKIQAHNWQENSYQNATQTMQPASKYGYYRSKEADSPRNAFGCW